MVTKMKFLVFFILFLPFNATSQAKGDRVSFEVFRKQLHIEFKDSAKSPLGKKAKQFKGHDFYAYDPAYHVVAKFVRTLNAVPFAMKTSTERLPTYEKFGEAHFTLNGEDLVLAVYQSHGLRGQEKYKEYLFLPFTDRTNGDQTYAGGRYIDLKIPQSDQLIIDFNKAYNPYCAYSEKYSCPIPPEENRLQVAIKAGIKTPDTH